ncbi:hypothetical protein SEUCBS139899_001990 [Sporothrix eucalyptigena]
MSITDEDLQFMADDMWKDALMPDLTGMYDFGENQYGGAAPGDRLLSPSENKEYMKPPASSASKKTTSAVKSVKSAKGKGKEVAMASPMTDLYMASPALVQPKKDRKMSKSMRGASQNELQQERQSKQHNTNPMFPELETVPDDPYNLPISPTQTIAISDKKKTVSPAVNTAKKPSPVGLIGGGISGLMPPLVKKPTKPQKRVAKRSFLDPSSSPGGEPMMTVAIPQPKPAPKEAPAAAPVKQPARAAKKTPAAKKSAQPKRTKKTVARPPAIKKESNVEPENDFAVKEPKKTAFRPAIVKKEVPEEPEDEWAGPVIDEPLPEQNAIKKLRPRGERMPIVISSDPASSYEGDDNDDTDSDVANNTSMTSAMTPVAQINATESIQKPLKALAVANQKMPAPAETTVKPHSRQKRAAEEQSKGMSRGRDISTFSVQPLEKKHKAANSSKRPRSPSPAPVTGPETKKHRAEPARTEKRKVRVQPTNTSDPFVEDNEDHAQQQTHFTAKLLQSAAPAVQPLQKYSVQSQPLQHAQEDLHQDLQLMPFHEVPRSHQATYTRVPSKLPSFHARNKHRAVGSDGIAHQMMQLLTAGAGANSPEQQASPKDVWLEEADPYKETGQIMTYVCRTVLRFLKSKEAAIEDVAEEYCQRGGAVLSSLDKLHTGERSALAQGFERRRQRSLAVFETARRDVQLIAGKLERVNLVPVIQDVLADNAGSRLRALQAQMV